MTEQQRPVPLEAQKSTEVKTAMNNFLHPDKGTLPPDNEIPLFGPGLRKNVDAERPGRHFQTVRPHEGEPRTLDEISYVVRLRYSETAERVDERFNKAMGALKENQDNVEDTKRIIGLTGAYNYARGMQVLRKTDPDQEVPHDEKGIPTGNVQRDMDIVPNFTLSPSALYQLQEHTDVKPGDDVLYLCSGAGGGIFTTAAAMPRTLDAVDLFTPDYYDLEGTFALAQEEIYAKVPPELKPELTQPQFIKADASKLPTFGTEDADKAGFQKDHYNKILLHPPYGRESMLSDDLKDITEAEGFMLWVKSILSANSVNKGEAKLFSIVPPEWGRAIDAFKRGDSMLDAMGGMYGELAELRYYEGKNADKLKKKPDEEHANALDERREEIEHIFNSQTYERHDLSEMGQFPLQINVLHLPGKLK